MSPLAVAITVFVVVILLTAIFLKIPNIKKDGSDTTRFNVMRIVLLVGVIVAGIIYTLLKK